jgi:hypothetical protein
MLALTEENEKMYYQPRDDAIFENADAPEQQRLTDD